MKNFTKLFLAACLFTGFAFSVNAQSVGINSTGDAPNSSAMLDVSSTTKGFLPPRMTAAEIALITSPANGLVVFNTTDGKFYGFVAIEDAGLWKEISFGSGAISPPFICGSSFADPHDCKVYTTVLIGTQCWMAQNLNVGTMIAGSGNQNNTGTIEKYCYSDLESNCTMYGGLYQWAEVVQYLNGATNTTSWNPVPTGNVQGICPTGWHLPTDAEWTTLTTYVSSQTAYQCNSNVAYIAKSMAATTNWTTYTGTCIIGDNLAANNATGFTALPGGYRRDNGTFDAVTDYGFWGSSTELSAANAWGRGLGYGSAFVYRDGSSKSDGFSVRCLRD